jgi:hypothetical protein
MSSDDRKIIEITVTSGYGAAALSSLDLQWTGSATAGEMTSADRSEEHSGWCSAPIYT